MLLVLRAGSHLDLSNDSARSRRSVFSSLAAAVPISPGQETVAAEPAALLVFVCAREQVCPAWLAALSTSGLRGHQTRRSSSLTLP